MSEETPWQQVNKVFAEAEKIEKLTRLYRESGISWEEAREKALKTYLEGKEQR